MLRYALQPRRHQHECRGVVREDPDDPRSPPALVVDALDPVVRPDLAPVLRREFRVGKRLGEPVANRLLVALCPDELGRRLVELCVERPLVDRYDVRRHGPCPFVNDLLFSRWKSYDGARTVFRYTVVNLRKKLCVTTVWRKTNKQWFCCTRMGVISTQTFNVWSMTFYVRTLTFL